MIKIALQLLELANSGTLLFLLGKFL